MERATVPVALRMKGAQDEGKGREPEEGHFAGGVSAPQQQTSVPTEEEVWTAMRDYARHVFGVEGDHGSDSDAPAEPSRAEEETASRQKRKVDRLEAWPVEPSVVDQVKSSAGDARVGDGGAEPTLEDHGDAIVQKSGGEPRKLATRQPDGGVQVDNAEDVDRVLSHAGKSPVYLPNPELEGARAKDEAEHQRQMGGAAAMGVMAPPAPALPRTHAAETAAQTTLAQKRSERKQRYEEAVADLRAYLHDRDEEQSTQAAAIKSRVACGEISEEAGQAELKSLMEAFHNRRLGDEVRANQALNGALRDYGEGLISAQQLNGLFEAAGAKVSGVQHYLRAREQQGVGREAEVKLADFAPPRTGSPTPESREWATDPQGHPAAYNQKTGEWHRTETQEMANVLDDAFETMERADRDRLFGEASKLAQLSWGRRQQLEGLLEEFPTYPGVGASSTEQGHVVALAQALRGMDATLRYAQQAEAEANAPRLTVPFYSFVEKGLEGAPMEEQQAAFAWGAYLMLDYLSLGTMGLATGPMRAIEPEVETLAAR